MSAVITVYTKDHCQPCKATKRKLDLVGLEYTEVNVEHDAIARQRLIAFGFQESPVVEAADGPEDESPIRWSGYRPDLIERVAAVARDAA